MLAILTVLGVLLQGAPMRSLDRGANTGVRTARQVTARTSAEWSALWREHDAQRQPPAIDFSKEIVVGVFLGSRPTAGFGVTIVSAAEEGGVLRVRYRETAPGPGAITAQVITFPYQIAAIPKPRAAEVVFEKVP